MLRYRRCFSLFLVGVGLGAGRLREAGYEGSGAGIPRGGGGGGGVAEGIKSKETGARFKKCRWA